MQYLSYKHIAFYKFNTNEFKFIQIKKEFNRKYNILIKYKYISIFIFKVCNLIKTNLFYINKKNRR